MSLFFGEHVQNVGGMDFPYYLEDVKRCFLNILQTKMKCSSFKQISSNEFFCKTGFSFKHNMNPGQAEISFTDNGTSVNVKIKVRIGQLALAGTEGWIDEGFELLADSLKSCPLRKTVEVVALNEIQIKCSKCAHVFSVPADFESCFCPKCGTKLARK